MNKLLVTDNLEQVWTIVSYKYLLTASFLALEYFSGTYSVSRQYNEMKPLNIKFEICSQYSEYNV